MIPKSLDDIIAEDIERLRREQTPETQTLEYKVALPPQRDKLLATICAFANTAGGDLLIGVKEKNGLPVDVPGLAITTIDATKQKIENWIRDVVAPPLVGVRMRHALLGNNSAVIVVRVPRSWNGPHRIESTRQFFARGASGKYPMSMDEIRRAFAQRTELTDEIRRFRRDRITAIASETAMTDEPSQRLIGNETPVHMRRGPTVVLHLIPLRAVTETIVIDIQRAHDAIIRGVRLITDDLLSRDYNLDGVVGFHDRRNDRHRSYLQIYRNGIIEAAGTLHVDEKTGAVGGADMWTRHALEGYLSLMSRLDIGAPVYLGLSALHVGGRMLMIAQKIQWDHGFGNSDKPRHPHLIIPEREIDDLHRSVDEILQPVLDVLWQAYGFSRCALYDESGRWRL